tara:strand:- start:36 stop:683 length:648 start_codon:yes stop_codon:yes gene_type:complete
VKKIISFSLWGDNPIYTEGSVRNAELALEIYPGWICRYYIGKNTPLKIIGRLSEFDNTEIYIMNEPGDWTGMFWRFYSASDLDVDVMISRDVDSRLTGRERAAVDEWLESDKDFHIMRDHPHHNTQILGGMWGVRDGLLLDMVEDVYNYSKGDFWQVDQNFLREIIYPKVKDNSLVHDEYFEKKSFPAERVSGCFIGQAFDENDERLHPEHSEML